MIREKFLTPRQRDELEQIVRRPSTAIYVLLNRVMRVSCNKVIIIRTWHPQGLGDLFKKMSFVDGKKAGATLVADGDIEVCQFVRDDVNALLEQDSGLGMRFYRWLPGTMCRCLRATNIRVIPV